MPKITATYSPEDNKLLMNPPFRKHRAHITAAAGLLKLAGMLVAIVPSTFEADGFNAVEHLPEDTFAATAVRTKIVTHIAD